MLKRTLCAAILLGMCSAGAEETLVSERMLEIERALYALGYHDEHFDALLDDETRGALRAFQTANGLNPSGEPDSATLALLDSGMGVSCHQYLMQLKSRYADAPVLQSGSAGDAVTQLQDRLRELGYFSDSSDGVFGDATLNAVKRFQMANGLTVTGSADRTTQYRLNEGSPLSWQAFLQSCVAAFGDSGLHVRLLQTKLQELGYFEGDCTGCYGELTQQAVMRLQEENHLEISGSADEATCAMLYEERATALKAPQTLRMGASDSESAMRLQNNLAYFGFFNRTVSGVFTPATESAVRLFQRANDLAQTGEADDETMSLLNIGSPNELYFVHDQFLETLRNPPDGVQGEVAKEAMQLRGHEFQSEDEGLCGGFTFVQYVCVRAGLPLALLEDLNSLIGERVDSLSDLQAGDVISIQRADGQTQLAIATGTGCAVYASESTEFVLETDLKTLSTGEVVRWNMQSN